LSQKTQHLLHAIFGIFTAMPHYLSRPFHKYSHMKSRLSPPCVVANPCRTYQCGGGLAPSLTAKSIDFICGRIYEMAY
jgi:hypothetical protein